MQGARQPPELYLTTTTGPPSPAARAAATAAPLSLSPPLDHDPQMFALYASDIHGYLRSVEAEARRRPVHNYMEAVQRDVTPSMRGKVVNWLVVVAERYKLVSDTLYLTVSLIDRFLSAVSVDRSQLHLLGISCMLIASKYEDISPPDVEDLCRIANNKYTKEEVIKMESEILEVLNFELGNPTAKTFLRSYMEAGQENSDPSDLEMEFLSNYLAELSLLDYGCVQFRPSLVAASVVFLARFTIDSEKSPWTWNLRHLTGYSPSELNKCVNSIHELQLSKRDVHLKAIREKYKHNKFKCVANLSSPVVIPASHFEDTAMNKV